MFWYVSYCLDAFGTVLLPCETRCKTGWNGAINAKVRASKSCLNFSQLTLHIHPIGPLNSCFGMFRTVWMHLGLFCCPAKLGAKRAEMVHLMQKFVPRSRVGIFHNERSRSSPLEPELMFSCILYCLDAFGTVLLPIETRCKPGWNGAINVKVCATKLCRNFSQRTLHIHPHCTLNSCFGMFRTVWMHLGLFCCLAKLGAKRAEMVQLMQKFVPRSRVGILCN